VDAPAIIRTGNTLESRFRFVAKERVARLRIEVSASLWREITTNATLPNAAQESFANDRLRFEFGAMAPGAVLAWQVAQQINPSLQGVNRGEVSFLDGERALASFPLALLVLP
jgi:hypothetical protein